jgi:carboxymethylenebutenolidase
MVTFRNGTESISGFLALPNERGRHGGIIALHEWWGLNDWVKMQATNLAANGYVVIAVDLYRGKVTDTSSEVRKLKRALPENRAIDDMEAAFHYLAARPDIDPKHIGSIGWSMGGHFAIRLGIHEPRLAAAVVNYGMPPTDLIEIQKINAQVLGHWGALDRGVPLGKVRVFEKVMKTLNKSINMKIYTGAGHSFENPSNKRGYRAEAAADAWCRTLAFLTKVIKSKNRKFDCGVIATREDNRRARSDMSRLASDDKMRFKGA